MHSPTRRFWTPWIAILAIVVNALLPGFSHALAAGQTPKVGGWAEVCSEQGTRWIKSDNSGHVLAQSTVRPAEVPAEPAHFSHCAYCLTHAPSFAFGLPAERRVLPDGVAHGAIQSPAPVFLPLPLSWAVPALRAPPRG